MLETYTITHPKTGKLVTFDWEFDTPPTVEEQADIIGDADRNALVGGAVGEVTDTAKGLWNTVKEGSAYGAPGIVAKAAGDMASGAWDALKRTGGVIGDAVSNPSIAGAVDALGRVAATPADLVTGGGASRMIDAGQAGMAGDTEQSGRMLAMAGMAALPFAKPIARGARALKPRAMGAPIEAPVASAAAAPAAAGDFASALDHYVRQAGPSHPIANPGQMWVDSSTPRPAAPKPAHGPIDSLDALRTGGSNFDSAVPVERPFRPDVFEAEYGPALQPTRTSEVAGYARREMNDAINSALPIERLDSYVADQLDRIGVPVERAINSADDLWMKALERDIPPPMINHAPQTQMRTVLDEALRSGSHPYKLPAQHRQPINGFKQ